MDAKLFELPDADDNVDIKIVSDKSLTYHQRKNSDEKSSSQQNKKDQVTQKVTPRPQDLENMLSEHEEQIKIWNEKKQKEKAGAGSGSMKTFLSPSSTGFSQVQAQQSGGAAGDRPGKISGRVKGMFSSKK
mmetsp:Transcript_9112/g.16397  ORF Transcript_9112/g.16397 Transcript_9112/m.16397 type:complete len:131 (-) Transcript_9112:287-679(-)|eukprot:CAMPEP_0182444442 /NCGR_PEP_ID=MMETSP1172-20130603/2893_1 /TAXON_ID=708627 /ORGANISM="Timspurckia oligopyrenoides, Strain CCMP3278" /LENGTH=130 /DNA_ID=CAMNT_0024639997 /DNA_START=362 /DNA_END=754 /DNA_ORIENTATION=-